MTRYERIPETIEAEQLSEENFKHLEQWTGGVIRTEDGGDPENVHTWLQIPSIEFGYLEVEIGEYVVKDLKSGRFSVLSEAGFEERYTLQGRSDDGSLEYKAETPKIGAPDGSWPNPQRLTSDHPSIFGADRDASEQ